MSLLLKCHYVVHRWAAGLPETTLKYRRRNTYFGRQIAMSAIVLFIHYVCGKPSEFLER